MDRDPVMQEVTDAITRSGRSLAWIESRSGVSAGTMANWLNGTVRRPQHLTVKFVLQALGFEMRIVDIHEEKPIPPAEERRPVPITIDEVFSNIKPALRNSFLGRVPKSKEIVAKATAKKQASKQKKRAGSRG